ncbi:hypothetical protein [Methylobacterium sp. sgz302541]|uniref:hypothetical protein n=1 Tax=unclassified Methylobacterium TaxID=2615210 RepID=UPI003D341AAE
MTTTKQVQQLVKPLLERNRDVVLIGRSLYLVPFTHIARSVVIDRCSDVDGFVPSWTFKETYRPTDMFAKSFGWYADRLAHPVTKSGNWLVTDPTMAGDLLSYLETDILPWLRSVDTLEKYLQAVRGHRDAEVHLAREVGLFPSIVLGDLTNAQAIWRTIGPEYVKGRDTGWRYYQPVYDKICNLGEPLMAGDRAALARLLHRWEEDNILGTKVAPYWVPAPFPLEGAPV